MIIVIDTCVIRYALESKFVDEKEKREAYESLTKLLSKNVIVVYNSKTISEISRQLDSLKTDISRRFRMYPSFKLLKILKKDHSHSRRS